MAVVVVVVVVVVVFPKFAVLHSLSFTLFTSRAPWVDLLCFFCGNSTIAKHLEATGRCLPVTLRLGSSLG